MTNIISNNAPIYYSQFKKMESKTKIDKNYVNF